MSFEEWYFQGITGTPCPGLSNGSSFQRRVAEASERQIALLQRREDELPQISSMLAREAEQSREVAMRLHEDLVGHVEEMTSSVAALEGSLSGHLGELKWLAEQQNQTLDTILDTLRHRRRAEAQELLEQALRHLLIDEYDLADERLQKALEFDTTDYQVLMNLAFIRVHQNDPDAALAFFQAALRRPRQVDRGAKRQALWEIARLRYATENFAAAYGSAMEALELEEPQTPRSLLTCAGYAALAGMQDVALAHVEAAVRADSSMMGIALVERDLIPIRGPVDALLDSFAKSAADRAQMLMDRVVTMLDRCKRAPRAKDYSDILAQLDSLVNSIPVRVLETPSYTDCVMVADAMERLQRPLLRLRQYGEPSLALATEQREREREREIRDQLANLGHRTKHLARMQNAVRALWILAFLYVPCAVVAFFLTESEEATVFLFFSALICGLLVWNAGGGAPSDLDVEETQLQNEVSECQKQMRNLRAEYSSLKQEVTGIVSEVRQGFERM